MTHENPFRGSRRPPTSDQPDGSSDPGRAAPSLLIEIPLEGKARVRIVADSVEDERRLRRWLRAALVRRGHVLATDLITLCDELDRREAA